jgi:transcriptional regulator with XRE-family HTH domain
MNKSIYTKTQSIIVRKLIKARQKAGLSQLGVAKILGRSQSFVSKLEAGQRRLDIPLIGDLAKIYNVDLVEFFSFLK